MEILSNVDGVRIEQKLEPLEIAFGVETENAYTIYTLGWPKKSGKPKVHKKIFNARERSGIFNRFLLGKRRRANFNINFLNGSPAIKIELPFRLIGGSIRVTDTHGNLLGEVKKSLNPLIAKLTVKDANGNFLYKIKAWKRPFWHELKIHSLTDKNVGVIKKRWGGFLKEIYTDADTFDLFFPKEADTQDRLLLMAATIFVDMVWFENNQMKDSVFNNDKKKPKK